MQAQRLTRVIVHRDASLRFQRYWMMFSVRVEMTTAKYEEAYDGVGEL